MITLIENNLLLWSLTAFAGCAAAALIFIWMSYRNFLAREKKRMAQARADIVDMTILAQTMRDIILQQKALAKQFNEELDRKMRLVKQVIEKGVAETEELRGKQFKLTQRLDEALEELASVQRQVAFLKDVASYAPNDALQSPAQTKTPSPLPTPSTSPIVLETAATPDPPSNAKTTATNETKPEYLLSAFADWLDADLDPQREPDTEPELEEEPEDDLLPQENPSEFREAFRALLNMPPQPPAGIKPVPLPAAPPKPPKPANNGGGDTNETKSTAPIQQRVLEYSAAGMDIPRIAKELGIGKGEVRLMLSLARKK